MQRRYCHAVIEVVHDLWQSIPMTRHHWKVLLAFSANWAIFHPLVHDDVPCSGTSPSEAACLVGADMQHHCIQQRAPFIKASVGPMPAVFRKQLASAQSECIKVQSPPEKEAGQVSLVQGL